MILGGTGGVTAALLWGLQFGPSSNGLPTPLRWAVDLNARFWRGARLPARLAPTYPPSSVQPARVKGEAGLAPNDDHSDWKLWVDGLHGGGALEVSLKEIKALPRVEFISELFCIEGWSVVVHWAGARLSDFAARYPPRSDAAHVGLQTPDKIYFVGLDMASAMHAQTLLCYEMNGQPLTRQHGAPLRLVVPTKYGFKSLKHLGFLTYSVEQPPDCWYALGYDYDSGL